MRTVPPVGRSDPRKSKGEPVTKLQTRLKELGYYKGELTGVCDEDTVAPSSSSRVHGLVADGEMSAADQQVLYGATAMEASVMVTPSPTPTVKPPTKTLRPGDKDDAVEACSSSASRIWAIIRATSPACITPPPPRPSRRSRKKSSLEQDGILGPITRTVLYGVNA